VSTMSGASQIASQRHAVRTAVMNEGRSGVAIAASIGSAVPGARCLQAAQPVTAAVNTISGNGRRHAKIPTKAASAITTAVRSVSARRRSRSTASNTMAMTAGLRP
jgi:hypothetical protein